MATNRSVPMLMLATVLSACIGCAAPVQPEFKSARSHQVNVDFENIVLLAKHGRRVLFPSSTPRCPYYDRRSQTPPGAVAAHPWTDAAVAAPTPGESEQPAPE